MTGKPAVLRGSFYWRDQLPLFIARERESFTLPLHVHDFVEIAYIAEGRGVHYIGSDRLEIERGDIFVIAIGTPHVFRPLSKEQDQRLVVYNCLFEKSFIRRFQHSILSSAGLERMFHQDSYRYYHYRDHHGEVLSIMEKLFMEYSLRLSGHELILSAQVLQLLSTLFRYEQQGSLPSSNVGKLEPVFKYIHSHYHENLKLEQLAALIHVSVSHLQRLFRQSIGQSYTEYIQSLRIAKSCELLSVSASIREISQQVGYNDIKFFHALFKKKTGMTPFQYRKKHVTH
ncbi:AraC family transcriptional regulator [Paenibacillus nasutitermitis]|uniref:HTH araC/xylS-type domain-containing protein n=1 Tax=Paenibacillus nasutitermitis TaxID=1652958 RepID=A0A917E1A1_9BACL|nr:AraC family transcriptional regulator [Paenibacillus nasutitermitis]GGD94259.1 hypothetical protein GCM10010911_61160 [Paenibacillus nasutitermitis]